MKARGGRRRREAPLEEAALAPSGERADRDAESADIQRAIMSLPDPLRTVFVLKQIEGYSHDEIAALLGISAGASRVRLTRALETLRAALR
jgi:RNA polymerase sigma-70 factor (ECF subfamily)